MATGFEVGVAAPPFTITLTPQGGGASITTSATVTGTATGRSINFIVPPGSASGLYTLTAAGAGYISGNSLPFTISGTPGFTLSPTSAPQGATIQFTVTGANTTFPVGGNDSQLRCWNFGGRCSGRRGRTVAVQPNGTAIATLVINASAASGPRSVTVAGVNIITQANAFTVITGTRTLTLDSIFPPSGVAAPESVSLPQASKSE